MGQFEELTRYIPLLENDKFGDWVVDNKNDGSPEHPIQMPFVNYSAVMDRLIDELYKFGKAHPEFEHTNYGETLKQNGLDWSHESMSGADISNMDAKCVIALLIGAVRAERFCDGALLEFCKDGSILRWLERLKAIDENN